MPMLTEGKTTGVSVKADVTLTPQDVLRVGAEAQQYRLKDWWPPSGGGMFPGTFWNIQDGQRDRTAVFGEWEARKNTQWMTLLGARVEQVKMNAGNVVGYNPAGGGFQGRDASAFNAQDRSKTDSNLDLTALARYSANASYDIEFGFAHKVRSPNVYERYTWSTWQMAALMNNFVGDGNGYLGDINLKPEKANTISATTLAANKFSVLKYANQSARLYGIDLSGRMPLAKGAWGDFGLKGLLNYTHGTNQDTGDGLYNVMPLNAKLALTQKLKAWDNSFELLMVQAKDSVSGMRNEIKTPGYSLVNLRGSYSWKQVRVDFGVENLFDKFYDLPTAGAYTGQGTTMTNPALPNYPQWGGAVPGIGRSIYMGVNVKF